MEVIPSAKMSKSKKNVVDPVTIIGQYGADTARWFVLSDSPPERDVEWTAAGAEAAHKHLPASGASPPNRRERPSHPEAPTRRCCARCTRPSTTSPAGSNLRLQRRHRAALRLHQHAGQVESGRGAKQQAARTLAQLMAPMTPHLSEELWQMLGGEGLVAAAPWPVADPAMLVDDTITLPVQINGKRRGEIEVPNDMDKAEVEKIALSLDAVARRCRAGRRRR